MTNFSISSNVQTVTPQLAADILKANTLNRPINEATVADYVDQMKKGLWKLNGEPIIIATGGQLLDGQHRLKAVVDSGVTISAVVIYNVDPSAFSTIDTGRVRTAGDIFSIDGIENANQKAAAVSTYFRLLRKSKDVETANETSHDLYNSRSVRQLHVSKQEVLKFYKENKELVDSVVFASARCDRKVRLLTRSATSAYMLYLVINKNHPIEKVTNFFYELFGVIPVTNKTVSIYNGLLLKNLSKQKILTPQLRHIYMIKTWNAYITGKELSFLAYYPDKEKKENLKFI